MKSIFLVFILFLSQNNFGSQQEQVATPQLSAKQKQIANAGALQSKPKSVAQKKKYDKITKRHGLEKTNEAKNAKKSPSMSVRTMIAQDSGEEPTLEFHE